MEKPLVHNSQLYFIHPFIFEDSNYGSIVKCFIQEESQWQLKVYKNDEENDRIRTEYFLPHIIKFLYPTMYFNQKHIEQIEAMDFHSLKELSSLDFYIKPHILEKYQDFQVCSPKACYDLSFQNIFLKIFHGGVGFLYYSLSCQKEELEINDIIQINQLLRPIRSLYKGFSLPILKFTKDGSQFALRDLLDMLLSEMNNFDRKEKIYNIYIDRLIFYSYVCLKKESLSSSQWIHERTDLLEALRNCTLFDLQKENTLLLTPEEKERVYFARHKTSIYGFSKEGGVLLSIDRDADNQLIQPNIHPDYIPNYFSTYYLDILLLGLYQRISLINYCRKLSMIKSLIHNKHQIEHIRFEILKFTNTAWFTQITNAELGMAIWKHWLKLFENETLYGEVKQGLDELDDFLENKRQNRFNLKIGLVTALTIPPSLIFSFAGSNFNELNFRDLLNPRFLISSFILFSVMVFILFLIDTFYIGGNKHT